MKQIKAIKKNGKPKKTEAKKLATILPDEYQEEGKVVFDDCYKKYQSKVKKESKCDSWVPFSKCFIGFAENVRFIYTSGRFVTYLPGSVKTLQILHCIFTHLYSKTFNLKIQILMK